MPLSTRPVIQHAPARQVAQANPDEVAVGLLAPATLRELPGLGHEMFLGRAVQQEGTQRAFALRGTESGASA